MTQLKAENEQILREAREERAKIIKEANEAKNNIVGQAKEQAKTEAGRIIEDARKEITAQKTATINEIKTDLGKIAINVAEKILQKELDEKGKHEKLVETLLDNTQFSNN